MNDATETVTDATETLTDATETTLNDTTETVTDATETVTDATETTLNDATETVTDATETTLNDATETVTDATETTLNDATETVTDATEITLNDATETVTDAETVYIDVSGKNFAEVVDILVALGRCQEDAEVEADQFFVKTPELTNNESSVDITIAGPTKKRKRNEQGWKRNNAKACRNSGQPYLNSKGVLVPKKVFLHDEHHICRLHCNSRIVVGELKEIFEAFWGLGDHDEQNMFVATCIEQKPVGRHIVTSPTNKQPDNQNIDKAVELNTVEADNIMSTERVTKKIKKNNFHKDFSRKFSFIDINGVRVQVCKITFINTLQISDGRLHRIMVTQRANHGVGQFDRRGKHVKKVIPESQKELVRLHIASIPSEQSHYTRNRTTRKFLSYDLNLAELYRMYTKECKSKNVQPVKEWLYRDIFANEFNLSFKPNRMDTCKKCDVLNNKIMFEENMEAKHVMEAEKDIHLRKADLARKSLQKDEAYSKQIFTESDNENEDIT